MNPKETGKILLKWKAPENEHVSRGPVWYFFATLIGGALILYSFLTGNFLFAVIIVMVAILMFLYHIKEARKVDCAITETGLIFGERFMPYKDIKNFWIVYEPPTVKKLYIEFKHGLISRFSYPLEEVNPNSVRKHLKKYIPEDLTKEGEPVSDILSRLFKI